MEWGERDLKDAFCSGKCNSRNKGGLVVYKDKDKIVEYKRKNDRFILVKIVLDTKI